MSFQLSSGTLDTMAGVFAPSKKYELGSGGGKGAAPQSGAPWIGVAMVSLLEPSSAVSAGYRAPYQTKKAFGGSSQAAVSRRAISTLDRTARRAPEVVVRITGRQHGGGHVLANFSYISRLGHGADRELALYTSDGDVIRDGDDMRTLAQDWQEWEMGDDARRSGATSISMILSMPAGTDAERLRDAALAFAREEFANRSWVASLHVDRDHPHVHLTIARRDLDGRRFQPDRDDLFRYRQRFAEKLRARGIEANATPAKARGVDAKHEPLAARKVREKGVTPRLDISRADRRARYRERGSADPAAAVLSDQHALVYQAYQQSIAELQTSPSLVDQAVAKSLERFVDAMQVPQPNSTRSVTPVGTEPHHGSKPEASRRRGSGRGVGDGLAAALARSKAMAEQVRGGLGATDVRSARDEERRQPGISERLRALMDEAERQSSGSAIKNVDDPLRQSQERARSKRDRDRDRAPEKGGPRR